MGWTPLRDELLCSEGIKHLSFDNVGNSSELYGASPNAEDGWICEEDSSCEDVALNDNSTSNKNVMSIDTSYIVRLIGTESDSLLNVNVALES